LRFPLAEEVEGVGEGAFMPVAEFALRKDMAIVVVVDAVAQARDCCLVDGGWKMSVVRVCSV
jgi:hypothetical protein